MNDSNPQPEYKMTYADFLKAFREGKTLQNLVQGGDPRSDADWRDNYDPEPYLCAKYWQLQWRVKP